MVSAGVHPSDTEVFWLGVHMEQFVAHTRKHGELLDIRAAAEAYVAFVRVGKDYWPDWRLDQLKQALTLFIRGTEGAVGRPDRSVRAFCFSCRAKRLGASLRGAGERSGGWRFRRRHPRGGGGEGGTFDRPVIRATGNNGHGRRARGYTKARHDQKLGHAATASVIGALHGRCGTPTIGRGYSGRDADAGDGVLLQAGTPDTGVATRSHYRRARTVRSGGSRRACRHRRRRASFVPFGASTFSSRRVSAELVE